MRLKMHYVSIAAFVAVIALIIAVTAIPVAADEWYQNLKLEGPTSGNVGDALTFTYSGQHCSGLNPKNPAPTGPGGLPGGGSAVCGPITGMVQFDVIGPKISWTDYAFVDNTGVATSPQHEFPNVGEYFVTAFVKDSFFESSQSLKVNIQSKVSPSPSGGTPSGGASASPSGGGLGLPALPALPNLFGQGGSQNATAGAAAGSAGTAEAASSAWPWLLAIAIIILLAIIAAVLLLRRRGEEERYEGRGHERRYRRR